MQEKEPQKNIPQKQTPQNESVSQTRNSWIRKRSASALTGIALWTRKNIPGLTANKVTLLGDGFIGVGSTLAALQNPDNPNGIMQNTTLLLLLSGSATDALDGSLAREIKKENPSKINSDTGQLLDASSDRLQEIMMAISRAIYAHKRGSSFGEWIALGVVVTTTLPSITRALSEISGKPVPETGKGIGGIIGARIGRASLGIGATSIPKIGQIPIQEVADTIVTVSSGKTAIDRIKVAINSNDEILPQSTRDEARKRFIMLSIIELGALGAAIGTRQLLNKNNGAKQFN